MVKAAAALPHFADPSLLKVVKIFLWCCAVMLPFSTVRGEPPWTPIKPGEEGLPASLVDRTIRQLGLEGEEKEVFVQLAGHLNATPILTQLRFLGPVGPALDGHRRSRFQKAFPFTSSGRNLRIYVFADFGDWPGMNDTWIVVADENENRIVDWMHNSQEDRFESVAFDEKSGLLKITCAVRRGGGTRDYRYEIGCIRREGKPTPTQ